MLVGEFTEEKKVNSVSIYSYIYTFCVIVCELGWNLKFCDMIDHDL